MKVKNNCKRMICLQTVKGRIDLIPTKTIDDDRLDLIKDDKVFKSLVSTGDIKVIGSDTIGKKTRKEILMGEASELGIDTTDMTAAQLEAAIKDIGDKL